MKNSIAIKRADYDYMDTMSMDGWFWEIIRRNKNYIKYFGEIEALGNQLMHIKKKTKNTEATLNQITDKFLEAYRELRVELWNDINIRDFNKLSQDTFLAIPSFFGRKHRILPRPDAKYRDIKSYLPKIRGSSIPIKIYSYDELIKEIGRYSEYPFKKAWVKSSAPYIAILQALTPASLEDSLYIGIPLTVKMERLEKELIPAIRKHVRQKKNRVRATDKWKFYLIAYDLKFNGYRYRAIADALVTAYSYEELSKEFEVKGAENYCKAASALINGGYKKYLYIPK